MSCTTRSHSPMASAVSVPKTGEVEEPCLGTDTALAIGECDRVVQDMGFPYIHFFHTYFYA